MPRLKKFFTKYSIFIFLTIVVFFRNIIIDSYIYNLDYNFNLNQKLFLIFINSINDFFILLFLFILSNFSIDIIKNNRKRLIYFIFISFLSFLIVTYLIDIGSIIFFGIRFHILKYIRNIILCNGGLLGAVFFFIALFCLLNKLIQRSLKISNKKILLILCFIGIFLYFNNNFLIDKLSCKYNYDIKQVTDNFLKVNLSLNYFIPYFNYKDLNKQYNNYFIAENGLNKKENIILIISESLSAINSFRTSQVFNYLPKIDNITKDGKFFINMISGGYGTRLALHSILEGDFTLGGVLGGAYFKEKYNIPLGSFFNNIGYETYFLAGCPLSFNHDFKFIKKCGYKYIYDSSDKFYKKFRKYTFNSPPDEALYKFALLKIKNLIHKKEKFFITMLTISGHTPYFSPYGYGERNVFHYIDDSFAEFYSELKKIKFFKNGILIVCGDHRQFGFIKKKEIKKYGKKYSGRIISFIIGKGIKNNIVDKNYYNQSDIYYSLIKHFGDKKVKIFKFYNDIFTGKIRRNFAFTYPADEQSKIYIYNKKGYGIIKLKGQWTEFIESKNIFDKEKKKILNFINVFRNYQLSKAYHLIK